MSKYDVLLRHLNREIRARKSAEDISEQKHSELYHISHAMDNIEAEKELRGKALKKQAAKIKVERYAKSILESILESSIRYSIVSTDLKGDILVWNEGAHKIYGYTAAEVVNKKNMEILYRPEDVRSGFAQHTLDVAFTTNKYEGIIVRVRKDKSHFIADVTITTRRNAQGKIEGFVMISKDITNEQLLKEQLIKSNQELEQFVYITSHDLKAPLRAIERLSEWILEDCGESLTGSCKENFTLIRQRVFRMFNLIDGILQYSKAGFTELDIDTVDVNAMIQEISDDLDPDKKFTIIYSQKLPVFQTTKILLMHVFFNLVSNSMKHHHHGKGTIEIGVKDLGLYYEFYVSDDGPGIDPQYFEKIFQIFQTLRSRDELESTGIGLSISKKLVESQGGKMSVESVKGNGSVFHFTWPKRV